MEATFNMKTGSRIWYVPSLLDKAIRVTVISIDYDLWGNPRWIIAEGKQGSGIVTM